MRVQHEQVVFNVFWLSPVVLYGASRDRYCDTRRDRYREASHDRYCEASHDLYCEASHDSIVRPTVTVIEASSDRY